jgi:L-methionine (R)-S-oxide reductase
MNGSKDTAQAGTALDTWLAGFLSDHGAVSGTVHLFENDGLRLASAVNIPEQVCRIVAWVPYGKGMAGLALERGVPVDTCNLKEDESGAVKPGAKAVDAKAAVAIPVKTAAGSVRAVVGIAFPDERHFSESDLARLTAAAATLPVL